MLNRPVTDYVREHFLTTFREYQFRIQSDGIPSEWLQKSLTTQKKKQVFIRNNKLLVNDLYLKYQSERILYKYQFGIQNGGLLLEGLQKSLSSQKRNRYFLLPVKKCCIQNNNYGRSERIIFRGALVKLEVAKKKGLDR